jgi:hydrogenase maturation protease
VQVRVISAHQLTPEMACDVAEAEFLLLLDADAGGIPGTIERATVAARDGQGSFTHDCTASTLLSASQSLYGRAPTAVGLTLSAASLDLGTELSLRVRCRLPDFLAAAKQIVSGWLAEPVDVLKPGVVSC